MGDIATEARRLVQTLGSAGARDLLKLLDQPDDVRADAFRHLHERGGHDALLDALTDLEADPVLRGERPSRLTEPSVPRPLSDWLRVFDGNVTWNLASEVRHVFTHRSTRRDIMVMVGLGTKARATARFEFHGTLYDVEDLMPMLLDFGMRRYSAFERALARAYPLRTSPSA